MEVNSVPLYEGETHVLTPSLNWDPVPTNAPVQVTGAFLNDSTNNHWYRDHRKGNRSDLGSNWTAVKSSVEKDPVYVDVQCHFGTWFGYRGPVLVHLDNHFDAEDFVSLFDDWATTDLDLNGLGSTAISKVLPTNPVSDVPTAVAEILGEGLSIPGSGLFSAGANIPRRIAGEYINQQFGVLPLLSDIGRFANAYQRAEELIDRYAKKSGTLIRRRYEFPVVEDVSVETPWPPDDHGQWFGGIGQQFIRDFLTPAYDGYPGVRTDTIIRSKKTWFSGAFTFYLPKVGNDVSSKLFREEALMRYLYGGISGNTAWELLPYSWAVDWLTNAGDVIHNVNAFARDGLVMPWGYVMERCDVHVDRKVEGAYFGRMGNPGDGEFRFSGPVTDSFSASYMRRRKATPFGFGLDVDGFTSRQKSIIAALGILRI
jgi:hypothetical protein